MPIANIRKWTNCPECSSELKFRNGYRENSFICTDRSCSFSESDSIYSFTDLLQCPGCNYEFIEVKGGGYRENGVFCKSCGLEEGDLY